MICSLGFLCLCRDLTEVRKKRSEELGLSLKIQSYPLVARNGNCRARVLDLLGRES